MLYILTFFLGASLASFIQALSFRGRADRDFLLGRSRCDFCERVLSYRDLIPIFSYLALRGRCSYCGEKISLSYPLFELILGFAYSLSFYFLEIEIWFFFISLISLLSYFSLKDIKSLEISDMSLILSGIFSLLLSYFEGISFSLYSFRPCLVLLLILFIFYALFKDMIGQGDLILIFLLSLFRDGEFILRFILYSIWSGGILALILLFRGYDRKTALPFIPFISLGYFFSYLARSLI